MKFVNAIFLSILFFVSAAFADGDIERLNHVRPKPILTHSKEKIVDSIGRTVILHGLNIMNKGGQAILNPPAVNPVNPEQGYQWFSDFYVTPAGSATTLGEQWAQFYATNGFNVARVGIFWNSVEPKPGVYDDAYISKIADMVNMFAKYGVFSILDFHQDAWYLGDATNVNGNPYIGFPLWAVNPLLISSDSAFNGVVQTCPMPYQDPANSFMCDAFPFNPDYNTIIMATWTNFWHNTPAPGDTVGLQDRFLNMYAHVVPFFSNQKLPAIVCIRQ